MPLFTLNFSVYGDTIDEIFEEAKKKIFSLTSESFDFSMQSQYEIAVSENRNAELNTRKLVATLSVRIRHA